MTIEFNGNTGIVTTGNVTANNFFGNIAGNIILPGTNTEVIFNDSGSANGSPALTFNKVSNTLTTTGNIVASNVSVTGQLTATSFNSLSPFNGLNIYVDCTRTDVYFQNGSPEQPFKTIAAAIAAAEAGTPGESYSFVLAGGTYQETIDLNNTTLEQVTFVSDGKVFISPTTGNSLQSFVNNSSLTMLNVRDIEFSSPVVVSGNGTSGQFSTVVWQNVIFISDITFTSLNQLILLMTASRGNATIKNVSYFYLDGAQTTTGTSVDLEANDTLPIPSNGLSPSRVIAYNIQAAVDFVVVGAPTLFVQINNCRFGIVGGAYTLPAGAELTLRSSTLFGTWTNNGTITLRNSSSDNPILGTAPRYIGEIGGENLFIDGNVTANANVIGLRGNFTEINVTGDINSSGNIIPTADNIYSLGNSTNQWKDIWVSAATIYIAQVPLTVTGTTLQIDGANVLTDSPPGGSTVISGNLDVDGDTLDSTSTTFNLLDTGVTDINLGGAATTLSIGAATGTTTINNNLTVAGTSNLGPVGNVIITGGSSGQILTTDGAGVLSWATSAAAYGNTQVSAYLASGTDTAGIVTTGNITSGNVSGTKVTATTLDAGNIEITGDVITSSHNTITIDPSTAGVGGLVVIAGNLQVTGTTTTVDSTVVTINDLAINVANNAATPTAANGGGLNVGPVGSEYATWLYNQATSAWTTALGITATGNISGGNISGTTGAFTNVSGSGAGLTALPGANVTGTVASATVAASANSVAGANVTGTVASATVSASANSVAGANVTGQVGNALVAGTVYTAAQPNITSVGTLSSLAVTGNVTTGNISGTTGAFTNVSGSGAGLTALPGANVTGTVASATVAASANSVAGANVSGQVGNALVAGTVYTAAQPNITSVGTLTALAVTGDISAGNITTTGNITAGNIVISGGSSLSGNGSGLTDLNASNISTGTLAQARLANSSLTVNGTAISLGGTGTVTANAETLTGTSLPAAVVGSSLTSVGTLTSLTSSGNITTTGNVTAGFLYGDGSNITGIVSGYGNTEVADYLPTYTGNLDAVGNITVTGNINSALFIGDGGEISNIAGANVTGQVANALVAGTVYQAAQPNITSVGTLTSLGVSGNVLFGNANIGNLIVTGTTTTANVQDLDIANATIVISSGANALVSNGAGLFVGGESPTVGSLTYLNASNSWNSSLLFQAPAFTTPGNVTADTFIGSGANLTSLNASNITTGTLAQARLANSSLTVNGTAISLGGSGTVTANAETLTGTSLAATVVGSSLTSVGTLASLAVTGNVAAGNVSTTAITATGAANLNSLSVVTSVSVTDNLQVGANISGGNMTITGNVTVGGNINLTGNITQISGNSGTFFGNTTTGFGALYAGRTGATAVPTSVIQASADANDYVQINFQNINSAAAASADYVLTADNGNDTTYYLDMGITSSTWNGTQTNSLGNALSPNDGYLYVQNGNLVTGTRTAGKTFKINVGGPNVANLTATFNAPGTVSTSTTTGALVLAGGLGASGNITAGNITTTGNITAGNVVISSGSSLSGNGSGLTDLNAANISTGTLSVARGGTGVTAPGTTGNVLTSDGTGWISGPAPVTATNTATLTNKTINLTDNTLITTSAQLAAAVTDETGSGSLVFNTTPVMTGARVTVSALGTLVTGTTTVDLATAQIFTATVTATNTITFAFSNAPAVGQSEIIIMRLTNAGSGTIVWPASSKFAGGTPPAFTTSGVDVLGIYYDVTTTSYMVFTIGLDVKA